MNWNIMKQSWFTFTGQLLFAPYTVGTCDGVRAIFHLMAFSTLQNDIRFIRKIIFQYSRVREHHITHQDRFWTFTCSTQQHTLKVKHILYCLLVEIRNRQCNISPLATLDKINFAWLIGFETDEWDSKLWEAVSQFVPGWLLGTDLDLLGWYPQAYTKTTKGNYSPNM